MAKAFLITFDPPLDGAQELHKIIDSSVSITDWMHFIKCTYIVISTATYASDLYDRIRPSLGDANLLVIEIDLSASHQGWLPQKAWDWINKNK